MNRVFIARGSGYADDKSFDGFAVIAEPCAESESRVFGIDPENGRGGTCYRAYSIKLATRERAHDFGGPRGLFLLVQHGGGREVWTIPTFYDRGEFERELLAMPERLQYAALMTLYKLARDAREQAQEETREEWARAFVEKRIRAPRAKAGRRRVHIEAAPQPQPSAPEGRTHANA